MKAIEKTVRVFLAILMIAMTVLTFYQIIMRFIFDNPSSWSEEAVRFLFVWASFVAAGIGIKEHIHIGIDVVVGLFPRKLQVAAGMLVDLAVAGFGGWLSYVGSLLMYNSRKQFTPALQLSRSWLYVPVVLFGVMVVIFSVMECVKKAKVLRKGENC